MELLLEIGRWIREVIIFWQPFIVFVTGCITFWLLIRTRPIIPKHSILEPGAVVINWSGHPLPEAHWLSPFRVWEPKQPPHFNTESWETILLSIQKLIRDLPQDIQLRMLQGDHNIVIVIPQLAGALSVLLAYLHGTMGVFPTVTCPLRSREGGFKLPEPANLSDIRLRARSERSA